MMQISVVTPTFNMASWLKLCMASIEDQVEVDVEHIVEDGGSSDETVAWLRERSGADKDAVSGEYEYVRENGRRYRLRWKTQADDGMYDAINHGLQKADGRVCAYLNADEQYLPGALRQICDYFAKHSEADVVCGDVVVIDAAGAYCCSRQVLPPTWLHTRACPLGILSAAMFFRRALLSEKKLYFDASWRNIGDAEWVLRALQKGVRFSVLREYVSVFTETGNNLNLDVSAVQERKRYRALSPTWPCWFAPLWATLHRLRRLMHGLYHPNPFTYAVYTKTSSKERVSHRIARPTFYWKGRFSLLR